MSDSWRLRLVGATALTAQSGPPRTLPLAHKDAAWLAYVALNANTASLRVAALVWPESSEHGALNSLRQRVYRLRKASGARVVEMAQTIALAADLQLDDFEAGERLAQDPAAWDGELLGGIEFDAETELAAWLAATRKGFAERRREALAGMASDAERAGELARALRYAQRLLADAPLSEHAHRRLMRLHYLRGDRAAALAAFEHCERVLKDEFGVKPGEETLALLDTVEQAAAPSLSSAPRPVPAALLRPPRTIGRDATARQLAQAYTQGQVPVLVGEAGLGKTRLLQDFVATQPRALYVQARPSDVGVPYGLLARLLRAVRSAVPQALGEAERACLACIAPELTDHGAPAAAPQSAAQLQNAVQAVLERACGHGHDVLVVDDLHFADRASIEMLRALLDAPRLQALRWVFAHRPVDAAGEDAALLRSLAEMAQALWIRLAPLDEHDLADLVGSLGVPTAQAATLVPALARHAGGNPLYVIETLRAMLGASHGGGALPRPAGIEQLIDRRLERLSKPALALARVAAIAVPDFSIRLAEQALATPALALADAWRELELADVLRGEAFAHDLVHDAVLRATPEAIARHARHSVAEFLAQRGADPARLALHWQAAGDSERAAEAWVAAAQRARLAMRLREELDFLQQALVPLQSLDAKPQLRVLLVRVCELCNTSGDLGAAQQAAERCLALAGSDAERLQGLIALMDVHSNAIRDAESLAVAQEVVACARRCGDEAAELKGWRGIAAAHAYGGRFEQAAQIHADSRDRLLALPPTEEALEWSINHAFTLDRLGRQAEAVRLYAQTVDTAQRAGFGRIALEAKGNQVMTTYRLGATEQALALAGEMHAVAAADDGSTAVNPIDEALRGALLRDVGRFDEALRVLDAAIASARAQGAHAWVASMNDALALAYARLGQHHRAAPLLADALATGDTMAMTLRTIHRVQAARLDPARVGMGSGALEPLLELDLPQRWRLGILLELALESGAEPGLQCAERAVAMAAQCGGPAFVLRARLVLTQALLALGESAAAAREATTAAEALASTDAFGVYRPESLWTCSRALAASRPGPAATLHEQALRWIERATAASVPAQFQDSFRMRNAVNAQIIRHRAPRAG